MELKAYCLVVITRLWGSKVEARPSCSISDKRLTLIILTKYKYLNY